MKAHFVDCLIAATAVAKNDHCRSQQRTEHFGPVALLLRRAVLNIAEFALHLIGGANPIQHGPGLIRVTAADKPSRAVGYEDQSNSESGRRNDGPCKHPAPRLRPGECVFDKVGDDDAAGESDLIDRNIALIPPSSAISSFPERTTLMAAALSEFLICTP